MMKKFNTFCFSFFKLFLSALSLLGFVLMQSVVSADTAIDTDNATADAFINVTAGNAIELIANPDFDFGTSTISTAQMTLNGTASTNYEIANTTGADADYTVQQTVSNFTQSINGTTVTLPVTAYYLTIANNSDNTLIGCSNVNVYNQAGTIMTSETSNNGVVSSGAVSAQLVIPSGGQIYSGTYNATVTTSLVTGV